MRQPSESAAPSVRRTLFGAACLSLQPLILNALSLPVMAYIIRQLGADGYGQWMAATSLIAVATMLSNLGLRIAFVRTVAAGKEDLPAALAEQLGTRLMLGLLMSLLMVAVCYLLDYPPVVLWCTVIGAVGLLLTTFATTLADVLQARHRSPMIAAVSMGAGVVLTLASGVAAWLGAGPGLIAATYLSGPLISLALYSVIVQRQVCPIRVRFCLTRLLGLLFGSRYFAAQQLLSVGSTQAVALVLPVLIGLNQFGFFTAGSLIATRLMVVPDALCTAAYPALVNECVRGRRRGAALMIKYLVIAAIGGTGFALVGMLAADFVGSLLFPAEPALFATVVRITIWSLPLIAVEAVMGYALNAAGKEAEQARASLPAAAVNLVGSLVLVATLGVIGASWAMLLRTVARSVFLLPLVLKTFRSGADPECELADALGSPLLRKAG